MRDTRCWEQLDRIYYTVCSSAQLRMLYTLRLLHTHTSRGLCLSLHSLKNKLEMLNNTGKWQVLSSKPNFPDVLLYFLRLLGTRHEVAWFLIHAFIKLYTMQIKKIIEAVAGFCKYLPPKQFILWSSLDKLENICFKVILRGRGITRK